ncbi:MAG: hypothetical protein FWC03_07840 [Treponema sp.]|nr:hypothetical protein [Treponema sp.]
MSCFSIGTGFNVSENRHTQSASVRTQYSEISMQEQSDLGLWVSGPLNGQFVIIGVSGRLSRPADEIDAAKLDAARKVSMYNGIQGSVEYAITSGSAGFFDYSSESKLELNYDTNYQNYVSDLSFDPEKDVLRATGATYIRFTYSGISSNLNYTPEKSNERPAWVNNLNIPHFDGYDTVVGFAGRRNRIRDTIQASCESAAARLIENVSTSVSSQDHSTTMQRTSSATATYVYSEGRLSNFQVLAFWIDPVSGAVSTLAAARISK